MIDITGDGLPDKVFKDGGQVYYRENLAATGINGFAEIPCNTGLSDFYEVFQLNKSIFTVFVRSRASRM